MLSRLPRRAVLPALGVVGLALVVMAPLTFGAGGLLGGGGGHVAPTTGAGTSICLLGCPTAAPSAAAAAATAPATTVASPARSPATVGSRPQATARPVAAGPAQPVGAPATGATLGPSVPQPVDQVTGGLPIVPTLPLGLPLLQPPGAPS